MFQSIQFGYCIIIAVSQYDQAKDVPQNKKEKTHQDGADTATDDHSCDDPKEEIKNIDQPNHSLQIELPEPSRLLICQFI